MNWDDLRYFLALHRAGTHTGAARLLDVNHATVSRRVAALEEELGGPLFQKTPDGWELTRVGLAILEAAEGVEDSVVGVERAAANVDEQLDGRVRVASSQFLNRLLVIPVASRLADAHPGISLEVIEGTDLVSLRKHEADIALRVLQHGYVPGSAAVRMSRLGDSTWVLAGRSELVEALGVSQRPEDLRGVPVVHFNEGAVAQPGADWLAARGTSPRENYSCNTMYGVIHAVLAGLGVGIIPRACVGDGVVALSDTLFHSVVWLAIHPDLQNNRRIRAVADEIRAYAAENPEFFE